MIVLIQLQKVNSCAASSHFLVQFHSFNDSVISGRNRVADCGAVKQLTVGYRSFKI